MAQREVTSGSAPTSESTFEMALAFGTRSIDYRGSNSQRWESTTRFDINSIGIGFDDPK